MSEIMGYAIYKDCSCPEWKAESGDVFNRIEYKFCPYCGTELEDA
jgi:hypothetical protein